MTFGICLSKLTNIQLWAMRSNAKEVMARLAKKFDKVKQEAPKILANEGQRHFNDNFRKQSYEGQAWKNVQRREPGTYAYKYARPISLRSNPILVGKTRRLKNAVNRSANFRKTNVNRIVWGVYSLNYAERQNEARPFMKAGPALRRRLRMKYVQIYRVNLR